MVAVTAEETTVVVIVNVVVAEVAPAAMLLGTWTAGLLLDKLMLAVPVPAPLTVTVPVADAPPATLVGAMEKAVIKGCGLVWAKQGGAEFSNARQSESQSKAICLA